MPDAPESGSESFPPMARLTYFVHVSTAAPSHSLTTRGRQPETTLFASDEIPFLWYVRVTGRVPGWQPCRRVAHMSLLGTICLSVSIKICLYKRVRATVLMVIGSEGRSVGPHLYAGRPVRHLLSLLECSQWFTCSVGMLTMCVVLSAPPGR